MTSKFDSNMAEYFKAQSMLDLLFFKNIELSDRELAKNRIEEMLVIS